MPQSYSIKGKVLRLRKSLYGLAVAPRLFWETMAEGLGRQGFVPSKNDPCLFVHTEKQLVVATYVDDCLLFGNDMKEINAIIAGIASEFDITVDDDVAGFLGIDLKYHENGSIEMLQIGLIERIITALGLEDDVSQGQRTPTAMDPLGSDKDGEPFSESFNYRSVVGMMQYLSSNSRPEIGFAVNQCARFVQNPTAKHGEALKRIGRYLLSTKKKGMIMKPNQKLELELFVDASFAGLWGHEDPTDPISVRSRTGYVITLGGTPIVWASKLQTETALSTMMAEYIGLSNSMRVLVPIRKLVNEVTEIFNVPREKVGYVTSVWEDNAGALALANLKLPQSTPASKFYAIKLHWFKEQLVPLKIEIKKIGTKEQRGDLWTNPFGAEEFERLRKLVCGW
jgi:hypothetical protein